MRTGRRFGRSMLEEYLDRMLQCSNRPVTPRISSPVERTHYHYACQIIRHTDLNYLQTFLDDPAGWSSDCIDTIIFLNHLGTRARVTRRSELAPTVQRHEEPRTTEGSTLRRSDLVISSHYSVLCHLLLFEHLRRTSSRPSPKQSPSTSKCHYYATTPSAHHPQPTRPAYPISPPSSSPKSSPTSPSTHYGSAYVPAPLFSPSTLTSYSAHATSAPQPSKPYSTSPGRDSTTSPSSRLPSAPRPTAQSPSQSAHAPIPGAIRAAQRLSIFRRGVATATRTTWMDCWAVCHGGGVGAVGVALLLSASHHLFTMALRDGFTARNGNRRQWFFRL